ncbi:MAG: hypothetical protein Q9O62_07535 [Ardenticatenia bacterium]|nr:hypothetical protein [Ardenticatenia bacterium]
MEGHHGQDADHPARTLRWMESSPGQVAPTARTSVDFQAARRTELK